MSTNETYPPESDPVPQATVSRKKGISLVWVVPLVAVFIAAGLIYKHFTEQGPKVTISFKTAEGLEAGKTKIKYKDLEVGEVESINISPDLSSVIVTARLPKQAAPHLTENTRFWVVRARLSGGVATGLGTIFKGAYIAIEPGRSGKAQRNFKGLEVPPVVTADLKGSQFTLHAPKLGSLDYGSPIYYRQIKVGQVSGYKLQENGAKVDIRIFIEAPYDRNVYVNSRFWLASGLDVEIGAEGLRINTDSIISMMIGGIAFADPVYRSRGPQAASGAAFDLFDSRKDAMAMQFVERDTYLIKFDQSVRGLSVGAPVEFRGFPIGRVKDINLNFDWDSQQVSIPVKIEIVPERIRQFYLGQEAPENALDIMVNRGLRAQLRSASLVTGQMYVAFDFFSSAEPARLIRHDDIIEIPTIPSPMMELSANLNALMAKVGKLPIEEIGDATLQGVRGASALTNSTDLKNAIQNLNQNLLAFQKLTEGLNQNVPAAVQQVSTQAAKTLAEMESLVGADSALVFDLKRALQEFAEAAQALRLLSDRLERHPESLLQGKGSEQ